MEIKQIKWLYLANIITLSGSSLATIPLGKHFSQFWGVGLGFAIIILSKRAPAAVLAPLYGRLAQRFEPHKVITYSQIIAAVFMGTLIIPLYYSCNTMIIVAFVLALSFSTSLISLFPAILNLLSDSKQSVQKKFSSWQAASLISLIIAPAIGGFLTNLISIYVFVIVDVLTFITAFIIWKICTRDINHLNIMNITDSMKKFEFRKYFSVFNITNAWRSVGYGILNLLYQVIILEVYGSDTGMLGTLYLFIGIASVFGGWLARFIKLNTINLFVLCLLELCVITISLLAGKLYLFLIFISLNSVTYSIVVVGLQTNYMVTEGKELSNYLSAAFKGTEEICSITGFLIFIFLVKQSTLKGFTILIAFFFIGGLITLISRKIKYEDKLEKVL